MKKSIVAGLFLALASAEYEKKGGDSLKIEVPDFPEADLDALYRSSGRFKDAKKAEFGAIKKAEKTIVTPVRSIDSVFLRLPSS